MPKPAERGGGPGGRPPVSIVTGATSGIGRELALALARRGGGVVGVGRDGERSARAERELRAASGNLDVHLLVADLAELDETRDLADRIADRWPRVALLVNNAAAMSVRRQTTRAGFERTFALDFLSPYLLTRRLEPALRAGAPARVVNVASEAHRGARLDLSAPETSAVYSRFGWQEYRHAKLALVLFTYELARRLTGSGITAVAADPGLVATGFPQKAGLGLARRLWIRSGAASSAAGAAALLAAIDAPADAAAPYWRRGRPAEPSPEAQDLAGAAELWRFAARATGLPEP